jgi:hypothetical protein
MDHAGAVVGPLLATAFRHGLFYARAKGTEKALVADLAPAALRGTAFGPLPWCGGFASLASVVLGAVWSLRHGGGFTLGAVLAIVAATLLSALTLDVATPAASARTR